MRITSHYKFWPERLSRSLPLPKTSLYNNLAVSGERYPDKMAIYYYGTEISYGQVRGEAEALAGFLQRNLGIVSGDRVLLFMQNSPQFIIAYYGILRANAVVVPLNPMSVTEELAFYIRDSGAEVAIVGQELYDSIYPLKGNTSLQHIITVAYSDYVLPEFELPISDILKAPPVVFGDTDVFYWREIIEAGVPPGPLTASEDDMALLPYTSGTTGRPKGCVHTHKTANTNIISAVEWNDMNTATVALAALPLFHVTGMQHCMNAPIFVGGTMVLLTRYDRDLAIELIERCKCTHWVNIAAMMMDFLNSSKLNNYDLSSLVVLGGGGAPLCRAIGDRIFRLLGIRYAEGFGMTETISQTHFNPLDRPKLQCIGIPVFDVDARVIDPDTLEELGPKKKGEMVIHGSQILKEYWNRPEESQKAFIEIEGKRFLRTGDIAYYDDEGYFFIVDRLKRMVNASGYKIWPAEVEAILYKHPAIRQVCVIGVPDVKRGETVKAYIVLHDAERDKVSERDIIDWSKDKMAAYKYPRLVQFVDSLPVSSSNKILWRKLQEEEKLKLMTG